MSTWPSFGSVVLLFTAAGFFVLMSAYVALLPPPPAPVLFMDTPVAVPSNTHPQERPHD